MFKVIVDSTADLPNELRILYGIDYCKMGISVDDREYDADLDYTEFSNREFNEWMRNGKRVLTTQVSSNEYINVFTKYLNEGLDVLYISCSSALSASYKASLIVKDELNKKYNNKVVCVDALNSSFGQGSMAIKASKMQKEGKSLDEVVGRLINNRLRFNQFATVDNLQYLKQAGRVTASTAFFGNLFGVKPIIISDIKGRNFAFKKEKGLKNAIKEIARLTVEAMDHDYEQIVYIGHSDDIDKANLVKEEIIKLEPSIKNFYIGYLGPIIGASVGPGTIGVYVFGNEVIIGEGE